MTDCELENTIRTVINPNCLLSAQERYLIVALAVVEHGTGACSVAISDLAISCNIGIRQVNRIMKRLKLCGAISVVGKRKTKCGYTNVYRISVENVPCDCANI